MADILSAPMDGKDDDAEALAKIKFADTATD